MKILFGGSFDPIHLGHLDLVKKVCDAYHAPKAYFVPANRNPLKKEGQTSPEQRLQMVKLALKEAADSRFEILDWETKNPAPSFTIDTLKEFAKTESGEIRLLMGDEVFAKFPEWKDPKRILQLCKIIVATRVEKTVAIESVLSKIGEKSSDRIEIFKTEVLPYSASRIRESIAGAPQKMPQGVQRSVWLFIKENHLYSR